MKAYTFQILQYRHDIVTKEFANVGVVIYNPAEKQIRAQVLHKYARISDFFVNLDGKYLKEKLKEVEKAVSFIQRDMQELFAQKFEDKTLAQITTQILPKDDGCFYFSEMNQRLDINIDAALEDIFARHVLKHFPEAKNYSTDESVWKELYKQYFDKYDLTSKLTSHTVKTQDDEFEFERAWKNGIWNVYEPISFDLQDTQNIKNKVYKWAGKISELAHTTEQMNLYFLSTMPKNETLQQFIKSKLASHEDSLKITIIAEQDIEQFITEQKRKIENHTAENEKGVMYE